MRALLIPFRLLSIHGYHTNSLWDLGTVIEETSNWGGNRVGTGMPSTVTDLNT